MAPLRVNVLLPAMKSAVLIVCVVATRPPTLTDAVGLKYTPFGLLRKT